MDQFVHAWLSLCHQPLMYLCKFLGRNPVLGMLNIALVLSFYFSNMNYFSDPEIMVQYKFHMLCLTYDRKLHCLTVSTRNCLFFAVKARFIIEFAWPTIL